MLFRNFYSLFITSSLLFSSFSSYSFSNDVQLASFNKEHAQQWTQNIIESFNPQEIQLTVNILYLLFANAVLDTKTRLFVIPLTRLTQTIRTNIINYKTTANELSTLKTLTDRLSHVIGARAIYNQMLNVCLEYYNNNSSECMRDAIAQLQIHGQTTLNQYAYNSNAALAQQLTRSGQALQSGVEPLQSIANFHSSFAQTKLHLSLSENDIDTMAALMDIDELLKNNMIATQNTEYALNVLDSSNEYILQLISSATEVYKEHYAQLYNYMMSSEYDQSLATTLFGINDFLPEEFKSQLPSPDRVFEHVLQTVKLYTQIEFIQNQ
jgi:hypothetical protein